MVIWYGMTCLFSVSGLWRMAWITILLLLNLSCINKRLVHEEYNLAQIALKAADESEAKRYAPRFLSSSKKYMKWGEKAYKTKNYVKSTEYFQKCRHYSEKAENISRLKLFQQGDSLQ